MAEIDDIMTHVRAGRNFLLSGGAGSGKTHTLVGVIRRILEENPSKHIACITYTNAAADEINRRVNHPNVTVSTIHDFLWENIKHYQLQLKKLLAQLVNDPDSPVQMRGVEHIEDDYFLSPEIERIDYKEYLQISKGVMMKLFIWQRRCFWKIRNSAVWCQTVTHLFSSMNIRTLNGK